VPFRAVDVALPLPVQSTFTYRVPDRFRVPERGARVVAPFGPRRVIGVVTAALDGGAAGRELKDVLDVVDEAPLVPTPLLDLAAWMADHYVAPPGECYRLVLPPDGVRASRAVARLVQTEAPSGDEVVEALRSGPLRVSTLSRRLGGDPASRLARLRRAGMWFLGMTSDADFPRRRGAPGASRWTTGSCARPGATASASPTGTSRRSCPKRWSARRTSSLLISALRVPSTATAARTVAA